MKKLVTVLIAASLTLSLSACSSDSNLDGKSQSYKNGFEYGQKLDLNEVLVVGSIKLCDDESVYEGIHGVDDPEYSPEEWANGCKDGFEYEFNK